MVYLSKSRRMISTITHKNQTSGFTDILLVLGQPTFLNMDRLFPAGWCLLFILVTACQPSPMSYDTYDDYPVYKGTDLGLTLTDNEARFRLWSPPATAVMLRFYDAGMEGNRVQETAMTRDRQGTWIARLPRQEVEGLYYTFQVQVDDAWHMEKADPYAKAVGVNGLRAQVVDLQQTNPPGWESDQRPPLASPNDIIIYELHVRDVSMDESSGIQQKGKFLGLTETGTTNPDGLATGLDHLVEMGITHLHLLPSFDYRSIDETQLEQNTFNWGYDPQHYNVPEGSYSTDPYDGAVRIREFKEMVQALHRRGIRVVMDVVYNHTGYTETSNLNQLVPGYYYRQDSLGNFSNASACGNETASERPMMRKLILESVAYWAREYHIDGFRFDLMGIHDQETMRQVAQRLHAIDSSIFVYGEGWTAGASPLPEEQQALKKYTHHMPGVAAFSDDIRDAIKGHVFTFDQPGFVSGQEGLKESLKFGVVASTPHPQVDYGVVNYSDSAWAAAPAQTITYASCHDNHTLWDRLQLSRPDASEKAREEMHRLALAVVLTAQGVPFLHAGSEFLRTKDGEENSFESPDIINQLDWTRKTRYRETVGYVKRLIALRKNHPAFRMSTARQVQQYLSFLDHPSPLLVAYQIDDHANGDAWPTIIVLYNGSNTTQRIDVAEANWRQVVSGTQVDENGLQRVEGDELTVAPRSAGVWFRED